MITDQHTSGDSPVVHLLAKLATEDPAFLRSPRTSRACKSVEWGRLFHSGSTDRRQHGIAIRPWYAV